MGLFSWFTRAKSTGSAAAGPGRRQPLPDYRAVEVVPCSEGTCNAVRAIAGNRFLTKDVPKLPLRECDRPNCNCTYRRHADRRKGFRRAADLGADISSTTLRQKADRRRSPGRRATDLAPNGT